MPNYIKSKHQEIDIEKDRDKYIGGSDLPHILRNSKKKSYETTIDFAKRKLGFISSSSGNEYTKYGHLMEPKVRDYINKILNYNFIEDSKVDEIRKYRANCDGIDRKKKKLLEVKTFSKTLDVKYYTPQCQFYMELFDIDECLLVGYDRPDDFYHGLEFSLEPEDEFFNLDFDETRIVIYLLKRDKEMFKKMEVEIEHFKYLLDCLREDAIINSNLIK